MENGDLSKDHLVSRGVSFVWSFVLTPLDLTGCTAVMAIDTVGTLTMPITVSNSGPIPFSTLAITVLNTSAWPAGVYTYTVRVTFPDTSVWIFGHGKVLIT